MIFNYAGRLDRSQKGQVDYDGRVVYRGSKTKMIVGNNPPNTKGGVCNPINTRVFNGNQICICKSNGPYQLQNN